MFRKHWPKFIPIFVILFVLLAGIVYRGIFYAPMNKNIVASFPHYSIKVLDRQYYFRPLSTVSNYTPPLLFERQRPEFDSPQQMRSALLSGQISELEANTIFYTTGNVDQEGDLYICDLDHLYMPVLEMNLSIQHVTWHGSSYQYHLCGDRSYNTLSIEIHGDQASYDKAFESKYQDTLKRYEHNLVRTVSDQETNGTIYYYSSNYPSKIRCYELDSSSGVLKVIEEYDEGGETPELLYLFGCHNGVYFTGYLSKYVLKNYWGDIHDILQSLEIVPVPVS